MAWHKVPRPNRTKKGAEKLRVLGFPAWLALAHSGCCKCCGRTRGEHEFGLVVTPGHSTGACTWHRRKLVRVQAGSAVGLAPALPPLMPVLPDGAPRPMLAAAVCVVLRRSTSAGCLCYLSPSSGTEVARPWFECFWMAISGC